MAEEIYLCPIHTDVWQYHRGVCHECGMVLVQPIHANTTDRLDFVCPVHERVKRSHPGHCPKCGTTFVRAA